MPARISAEARAAVARVLAGESISKVSRETGVSRSTIYRHLRGQTGGRSAIRA